MREIKFRGLRKVGKQMIVGDLAKLMHEDNLCIMPDSFYGTRDFDNVDNNGNPKIEDYLAIGGFYPVIKETVGQSIGLKDNQGKEYFFDDIIKFPDDSIGVLVWFGDCLGIGSGEINNYHATDQVIESELSDCTIIGNIHENPELLNA